MNVANLQKRYEQVLTQYKQAVADYLSMLQSSSSSDDFVSVPKSAFVGNGSAGQSTSTTLQECEASCASNAQCSGATFVSGQCQLRSGDGPLVPSSADSYALLPKRKHVLLKMENLNQQLMDIHSQIVQKIGDDQPLYEKVMLQANEQHQLLRANYADLAKEREKIRELLDQYQTLEETQREEELTTTQNYYVYWFLLVLALVLMWVFVGMPLASISSSSSSLETSSSNLPLIGLALIVCVVVIRYWMERN